jgi:hypothetical protein
MAKPNLAAEAGRQRQSRNCGTRFGGHGGGDEAIKGRCGSLSDQIDRIVKGRSGILPLPDAGDSPASKSHRDHRTTIR